MPSSFIPNRIYKKIQCHQPHYCVITCGGKVISTGYNKPRGFSHNGYYYGMHAECDALKKLPFKYRLKGSKDKSLRS